MKKNRLYGLLLTACAAGLAYTAVSFQYQTELAATNICLIKHVTNIPCPSCGSTRSVLALLQGDMMAALTWNPIGLLLFMIMIAAPVWILYDTVKRRSSLYVFYGRTEIFLQKKWVLVPALILVTGNWIWNIYKAL